MTELLMVAIGLPLAILLFYFFAGKHPEKVRRFLPWAMALVVLAKVPQLYTAVRGGAYGLSFWLAAATVVIAAAIIVLDRRGWV